MGPLAIDACFERFRDSGEPRWLAAVFDAAAPELARVAAHLCRHRHDAEDAVQSAFLAAIEARAQWDSRRPVLPWLLGLLANRVHEQRRRFAVNHERERERRVLAGGRDPCDAAADGELAATCRDALARLEEPYRSTLEAHLVRGLAPVEIAAAHGVAAGTVRMRVHRGLDRLRHELPAGFARGVALAPWPAATLAKLRGVVLQHAQGTVGAFATGSAAGVAGVGVLLMKKATIAAVAVVALLAGAWLLHATRNDAPEPVLAREQAAVAQGAVPDGARAAASTASTPEAKSTATGGREAAPAPLAPAGDAASRLVVHGRVLLPAGEGAAGASVHVGNESTIADTKGAFTIRVRNVTDDLVAWSKGYEPAAVADVASLPDVVAGRELDVVLPGEALSIDGVLVTADGEPCTGWHLRLHGGVLGIASDGPLKLSAEDFAAGAMDLRSGGAFFDDGADGQILAAGVSPDPRRAGETLHCVNGNPNHQVLVDDGVFCVSGLRRGRDYVLRAWNEKTLQRAESPPIPAGTHGYRFVLPPCEWRAFVRGRVIDRSGGALAGVRVRLTMRVHVDGDHETYQTGQEARTDADGRFVFQRVPCQDLLLRFDASDVIEQYREFPAGEPADDLIVSLDGQARFRFEPQGEPLPTSVRVLDQQQQPLRILRTLTTESGEAGDRLRWHTGSEAHEIAVSDRATWLLIEREGAEPRRLPMRLQRGQLTVVRD